MPLDWIDAHQGNVPQINREDAGQSDAMKAVAEDRSRGLRVPGVVPGKLIGEEGAMRGLAPSDPRGLVFDEDAGALRPYTDDDMAAPKRAAKMTDRDDDKPATQRQQEQREQAAAERRSAEAKK